MNLDSIGSKRQWSDSGVKGQESKGPAAAMQHSFPIGQWESAGYNLHKVFGNGGRLTVPPCLINPPGQDLRQSLVARLLVKGREAAMVGDRLSPPPSSPPNPSPTHDMCAENGDIISKGHTQNGDITTESLLREVLMEIEDVLRHPPPPSGPGCESRDQTWKCRFCSFHTPSSRTLYSHYQFHQQLLTSLCPERHLEWIMAFRKSTNRGSGLSRDQSQDQGHCLKEQHTHRMPENSSIKHPPGVSSPPAQMETINGLKHLLMTKETQSPASSFLRKIVQTVIQDGNPAQGPTSISAYDAMLRNAPTSKQTMNGDAFEEHTRPQVSPDGAGGEPCLKRSRSQSPPSSGNTELVYQRRRQNPSTHEGVVATVAPQPIAVPSPNSDSWTHVEKGQISGNVHPEMHNMFSPRKQNESTCSLEPDDLQPVDMRCSSKQVKEEPSGIVSPEIRKPMATGPIMSHIKPVSPMSPPYSSTHVYNHCPVHPYPGFSIFQQSPTTITPRFSNEGQHNDCLVHPKPNQTVQTYIPNMAQGNPMSPERSMSTSSTLSNTSEETAMYRQRPDSEGASSHNSPGHETGCGVIDCTVKPLIHRDVHERRQQDQAIQCDLLSSQDQNRKCFYCGISFEDDVVYSIHMGTHNHLEPFICNICGYQCENKYGFNTHIMRGHVSVSRIS